MVIFVHDDLFERDQSFLSTLAHSFSVQVQLYIIGKLAVPHLFHSAIYLMQQFDWS